MGLHNVWNIPRVWLFCQLKIVFDFMTYRAPDAAQRAAPSRRGELRPGPDHAPVFGTVPDAVHR